MHQYHPYARPRPPKQPQPYTMPQVQMPQPSIAPHEIRRETLLGTGSFGEVWKGTCRGKDVAIKILTKQELDEKTMEEFKREVDNLSKIPHPNIIQFMGACFTPGNLMIVTEYLERGDLDDMLSNPNIVLSLTTRMIMARDVAYGMNWLHKSNPVFIHRDLKTKNLLVGENNTIKICDFGLSQVKPLDSIRDPPNGAKGTPLWMAPEILMNLNFNESCDIYSYGIILWCLVTRREPFQEYEDFNIFRNDVCRHHKRPTIPDDCPQSIRSLISACWDGNPTKRPPFEEIIRLLNYIIIECAIQDEFGREFWSTRFLGKANIPWNEFSEAFHQALDQTLPAQITLEQLQNATVQQLEEFGARSMQNLRVVKDEYLRRFGKPDPPLMNDNEEEIINRCLHALLTSERLDDGAKETVVNIEKFGEILLWFGPSRVNGRIVIVERILSLLSNTWFHGDIDQNEAESRLNTLQKVGGFLVRFSATKPGTFTISTRTKTEIEHRRITRTNDMHFQCSYREPNGQTVTVTSPTLIQLIEQIGSPLQLFYPCGGSRFLRLLTNDRTSGSGYVQVGGSQ